jgi:hypothetical protein
MKYAKKIQLFVEFQKPNRSSFVLGRHGEDNIGKHHVVRRYLQRKQVDVVKEVLPENVRPYVIGVNFSEISLLGPHTHTEEKCVINFYQHVNGEVTSFWEGEIERDDRWTSDNGKGYINVNPDKIKIVESFKAESGDVWILNATQPHSVTIDGDVRTNGYQYAPENDNVRLVVQAFIDLPYSDVVEALENKVMQ